MEWIKKNKWIVLLVIAIVAVGIYFWLKRKKEQAIAPPGGGGGGGQVNLDPNALDANGFHINQPTAYTDVSLQDDPVLKYGTMGAKVIALQTAINTRRGALSQTKITEDGKFGKTTEQALSWALSPTGTGPGGAKELLYSKINTIPIA